MPKFVLFLRDDASVFPKMSPEQMQAIVQRYVAWRAKVEAGGRTISGHKLHDKQGKVLARGSGGVKVTDGPYAEAQEVLGGIFVIEANSYDEIVGLANDCPHLDFGTIEIRQVQPTS